MKKTIFLTGPSDKAINDQQLSYVKKNKMASVSVTNCLSLDGLATKDKTVSQNSKVVVFGLHKQLKVSKTDRFNAFNLIADADASTQSLTLAKSFLSNSQIDRVFNHPDSISKTTRLNTQFLFSGIDGLILPKVVQISAVNKTLLKAHLLERKLKFPLIIRDKGVHNGESMHLIREVKDIDNLSDSTLQLAQEKLCIEFLPTTDSSGLFHKCRIAFVDGQIYPRHKIFSDHWCVHSDDRERLMMGSKTLREKERTFLNLFHKKLNQKQKSALTEMNKRIGLDVWGMDFSINDNGDIILFEANPCMNFFGQKSGPNKEFEYILPFQSAIRRAIKKMVIQA